MILISILMPGSILNQKGEMVTGTFFLTSTLKIGLRWKDREERIGEATFLLINIEDKVKME
eukprot:15216350-Ditylum_brightwellii.AAC.1